MTVMEAGVIAGVVLLTTFVTWTSASPCYHDVCRYNWVVRNTMTMTYTHPNTGKVYPVELYGNKLYARVSEEPSSFANVTYKHRVSVRDVITVDGAPWEMTTVNNMFPGPAIEVLHNSLVIVHVTNMASEDLTVHFHGMFMRGNTWSDGVPNLTQTALRPGESFTYRFRAHPFGNHWYHTHVPGPHVDRLYGPLIVHRRQTSPSPLTPPFREATVVMVTDWKNGNALVNGRGRVEALKRPFPLTVFHVERGERRRFYVGNFGDSNPIKVSIDGHVLRVVALDGFDIKPIQVDFVMMHVAERVDFELDANQPPGRYWLRVEATPENPQFGGGLAILDYSRPKSIGSVVDPQSRRRRCTAWRPCRVYNCFRQAYPTKLSLRCMNLKSSKSAVNLQTMNKFYAVANKKPDDEIFLHVNTMTGFNINGISNAGLRGPYFAKNNGRLPCSPRSCSRDRSCRCTHEITLGFNRTVDLVIFSRDVTAPLKVHPMHIHGHNMAILAIGYPIVNASTGEFLAFSPDMVCESHLCRQPRWTNGRPPLNLVDPPIKDTVVFPAGGYVIARIRSDNPGVWLFHCHIPEHVSRGMGIIISEAPDRRPSPPGQGPRRRPSPPAQGPRRIAERP